MSKPSLRELQAVAMEAAYLGGRRALAYFNSELEIELKADASPVTRADREAEALIRQRIQRSFPNHSILGEEGGEIQGHAPYRWIIDPLDGTKTFVQGVPFFGTLIGIEVEGQPSVGVVYLPVFDEMIAAATGFGCQRNGREARVSKIERMEDAVLLTTSVTDSQARSDAYNRLAAQTKLQRTWGDCYGYVLVATGRAEIMLDPIMNPWDNAPLLTIMQEAGGHFTNWDGQATIWGHDAVATNAKLHAQALATLKSEIEK